MMPKLLPQIVACGLAVLAAGCASHKEQEKPLRERGWIGGEYHLVRTFPTNLTQKPKAALLAVGVATNSPAYAAGLREGDLILALDHQAIKSRRDLYRTVGACKPGSAIPVSAWRDGQSLEWSVPIGREKYRPGGTVAVGLPCFAEGWQFWPGCEEPGFSLLVVGGRWGRSDRTELGSPENAYSRRCDPHWEGNQETWSAWLAILRVAKWEHVIAQESVPAP